MNNFYVYHLIDPITNIPFYIGKGTSTRMFMHEQAVRHGKIPNKNKHLFYKIKNIISTGLCIIYKKIYETTNEDQAYTKEKEEIKIFGISRDGGILCNLTYGGDGAYGYKYTNKQRQRAKETHNTPEYIKNISTKWKEYYKDPKTRQFQSELRKKHWKLGNYGWNIKNWIFINPQKQIIKITNLRKYCRENGMGMKSAPAHLRDVHLGIRKTYKGWTKYINVN